MENYQNGLLPNDVLSPSSGYLTWIDYSQRMKNTSGVSEEDMNLFTQKYWGFIISRCIKKNLNDEQTTTFIGLFFQNFFIKKRFMFDKSKGSFLHRNGFRFRLHVKDLPGKLDIVLPKYKTVIEVRGCYWHRHEGCKDATTPSTNTEFWQKKFAATVARDKRTEQELKALGWKVIVLWEREVFNKKISLDSLFRIRHYERRKI